jgi:hypothetical protein
MVVVVLCSTIMGPAMARSEMLVAAVTIVCEDAHTQPIPGSLKGERDSAPGERCLLSGSWAVGEWDCYANRPTARVRVGTPGLHLGCPGPRPEGPDPSSVLRVSSGVSPCVLQVKYVALPQITY